MSDTSNSTPETKPAAPKPETLLSKGNIAIALGVVAIVLAGGPYVVPGVQSLQVRQGLLSQPRILEETVKALEVQQNADKQKKADVAIKANYNSLYADKRDPVLGNPNAPITVIEFADYNCGVCKGFTPALEQLIADNPDVRIVVKEYPILGTPSRALASYAIAANEAGRYDQVHHAFMATEIKSEADIATILRNIGLNPAAIAERAKSKDIQAHVDAVAQLGTQLQIDGTPTFIVDGVLVNGADINALKVTIEAQRVKLAK